MAPQPGTTTSIASYLTTGYWQDGGQTPHHWDTSSDNVITVNLTGLTPDGQALARAALDAWEMIADIQFRETTGSADITFDDTRPGATTNVSYDPSTGLMTSAQVNIGTDWLATYGTAIGGYAFQTYMHEIGHALGLGHAGDYSGGSSYANAEWTNDSWQQSVMSYLDQDQNPNVAAQKAFLVTPMMADVQAIQAIYGAPTGGPTAGATTYGVGSDLGNYMDGVFGSGAGSLSRNAMTIFDEGGTDTINFSDDTKAEKVDLNDGTFSSVYGLTGNLGIAKGTTIENYKAGSGSDSVTGNEAANLIKGNSGDDKLNGQSGGDSLYGGEGRDSLTGGDGKDQLWGDASNDTLDGGTGDDSLFGGDGNDSLSGADGLDLLKGGAGNDKLAGGAGNDTLSGEDGADKLKGDAGNDKLVGGGGSDEFTFTGGKDTVTDFENDKDTLLIDDALWGGKAKSVDQVLDFASVHDGDVLFDFGNGNKLVLDGFSNIDALSNDLTIV